MVEKTRVVGFSKMIIKGKSNSAVVYAKAVEERCENQILQYLNDPLFADTKVRIMPDVHLGNGATVGFTATRNAYVVPSIIGVDIGCGVSAYNLGSGSVAFDKLDKFIRKRIPSGRDVNPSPLVEIEDVIQFVSKNLQFDEFMKKVGTISDKTGIPVDRSLSALGTLGGGNHFIEIDKDKNKNRWLLIHTGSRGFGLHVSEYYQRLAAQKKQTDGSMNFLINQAAENYLKDMQVAQLYAKLNRTLIAYQIISDFFKLNFSKITMIDSTHNYIDFEHEIIRKGAISAQKGEPVVIPFSMADGAVIGVGKGNAEWNFSAPHGSGRKISRTQAQNLSMEEYRKRMKNIWSSCINQDTVDESPMAYKSSKDILSALGETVHVTNRILPIYNFKAGE